MTALSISSLLTLGESFATELCNSPLSSFAQEPVIPPPPGHHRPHPDDEGCKLLDSFAILVQLTLASTALITLFYKRSRERPQRPVIVWALDVGKQFAGAGIIHFLNLFISYLAGRPRNGGPRTNLCVWYFLNVAVDTTIGVAILYMWLRIIQFILEKLKVSQIKSGQYGPPPIQKMLVPWIKQTTVFILAESLMKFCVFGMFRHLPFLFAWGEWALQWTKGNYKYQVIFVMLIFPLTMNIIQFWIVDTIVKVAPSAYDTIPPQNTTSQGQLTRNTEVTTNEESPLLPK